MSDHLVLYVDRLIRPVAMQSVPEPSEVPSGPTVGGGESGGQIMEASGPSCSATDETRLEQDAGLDEEEPLIQMAECRICQEEDGLNNLETPCGCSGSLKVYFYFYSKIYK